MKNGLILSIGLAGWIGLGESAFAEPDLTLSFSPRSGRVQVKNVGDSDSGVSAVAIVCTGLNGATCPEPTPFQLAGYLDPEFPDMIVIDVPPLVPGKTFKHTISFYDDLVFEPGTYRLAGCVFANGNWDKKNVDAQNCFNLLKYVRHQIDIPG